MPAPPAQRRGTFRLAAGTFRRRAGEVSYAMFMAQLTPRTADALPAAQAQRLQRALDESADVTVFVNGTAVKLPAQAADAVVDMLRGLPTAMR